MRQIYFFTLILLIGAAQSLAQTGSLQGKIQFEEQGIEGVAIWLKDSQLGSLTDKDGTFELLDIPVGSYELLASPLGFMAISIKLEITEGELLELGDIAMRQDVLGLEDVVITGTMKRTSVAKSPVKIDVIKSDYLFQAIAPTNLMEGLNMINGVQEVVACGVCFTNNISVNGLPGQYTAVLMDGSPIYGNLASTYGLNSIPTTIIDRIEVVKGPNSTLYGSEAVAGVINIITKDPKRQPMVSLDFQGSEHEEYFLNASIAAKAGPFHGYLGINYGNVDNFEDDNQDGFGDIINMDRLSIFTKWSMDRKSKKRFDIAAKLYYEDRRNGVEEYLQNKAYRRLRGNDSIYGESIFTRRAELFGTYEFNTSENIRIDYSLSTHYQNSYYGSDFYEAQQHIGFANFIWDKKLRNHGLLVGLTSRYDFYDDNTIATQQEEGENLPQNNFIPGIFFQDEWEVGRGLTVLSGIRLDHQPQHGLIPSPRLALKYKPGDWTTFRINGGTGFKTVNLFTEDHAFVSGQREVVIEESLLPERSFNLALNLNHLYLLGEGQGMLDVDLYHTYFTNKIIPDYEEQGKIIYSNTNGHAVTQGINVNIQHQFGIPLSLNTGINIQQAFEEEDGEKRAIEFAPNWGGVFSLTYDWKKIGLTIAYTINATGPMALPEVYELNGNGEPLASPRPIRSEAFAMHNLQFTKQLPQLNLQLYGGIQNIGNYRQPFSPLVGINDPSAAPGFSEYFDTAYAYASLHGREFYGGIRWNLPGRKGMP